MKHVFIFLLLSMCLHVHGVFDADTEEVSVMEGDSVTLNTGVQRNQQEEIKWYFEDIRIALITGDLSYICTDVQCNEGTERFRDRLKLDHQTGSLTITNTRITHSGDYELVIISSSSFWGHKKIFRVSVYGVFDVDTEEVSVKEGDSVTLYTGVQRNQQEEIKWYFKYIRIAQITGDLSYICTDVQCNEGTERFRDRLKLDHQTGSLTITNTRITHSGDYDLMIISSSSFWGHEKIFRVSVYESDSGLSPDVLTGIFVAVVVLLNVAGAAGLIYCCKRQARRRGIRTEHNDQANGVADSSPGLNDTLLMETIRDSSPNQDEPANDVPT